MPLQQTASADKAAPSPRERARILEAIRFELAIEELNRANSRRNVRLRISIGLPAFPRTITEGVAA